MTLPSLRGSQAANCGAATSGTASLVLPSGILDGEIGVLVLSSSNTAAVATTPAGWTLRSGPDDNSAVLRSWLYTRTMAATDSGTTLNVTLTSSRWTIGVAIGSDVTGVDSIPAVVVNSTLGTTSAMALPALSPVSGQCFGVLAVAAQRPFANTDGGTAPNTWTEVQDSSTSFGGASDFTAYLAWKALVASGIQFAGSWAGQSRSNVYVVLLAPSSPTGNATFTGTGSLTASATPSVAASASFSGTGSLTGSGSPAVADVATFSGTGALAGSAAPSVAGTAVFAGAGSLTATGSPSVAGTAVFSGTGSLTATATMAGAGRNRLISVRAGNTTQWATADFLAGLGYTIHDIRDQELLGNTDNGSLFMGVAGMAEADLPHTVMDTAIEVHVDTMMGATDVTKLAAACTKATAVGGVVVLPDRPIDVGNGFPMAGYSCGIRGRLAGWSPGGTPGTPTRSVIYASTQTGPVLDFTGFIWTRGFRSAMQFSDFAIRGSGVADPTLANIGIFLDFQQGAGVAVWRNLVISNTGGPCFQASGLYLHNFENIRLIRPISAKTNDVPYMWVQNATQCNFNLDLYSPDAVGGSDDCGPGGCFVATDDTFFASTMNHVDIRCENIHMPTGGTIIHYAGNDSTIELRQSDCKQESGATDTCFIRLAVPAIQDFGGNTIQGVIRGSNGGTPICTVGNDIYQSRNRIVGAKGFKGDNVRLNSGVGFTYISLEGAHSGATDPGVIDSSGETTNSIFDFIQYPGTGLPPVTPGIGISQTAYKTTVEARTSTVTIASDPELTLAMAVGTYSLEAFLRYDATATGKIKGTFDMDTGAGTGEWAFNGLTSSVTASVSGSINCADTALAANQVGGCAGAGTLVVARPVGIVEVTSAGNFVYSFAQNGSDATPTNLQPGSWMRMTKIA